MCFGGSDRDERPQPPIPLQARPPQGPQPHHHGFPATQPGPSTQRSDRADRPKPPKISKTVMPKSVTLDACRRIADTMDRDGQRYALVGGGACIALGADRGTADLDIIVPNGQRRSVVRNMAQTPGFGVHPISHNGYIQANDGACHNVDVLEPGAIYAQFDNDTPTVEVNGLTILHPAYLLRTKIISWMSDDRKQEKRLTDALDIVHLVRIIAQQGTIVTRQTCEVADEDFYDLFLPRYPQTAAHFQAIGLLRRRGSGSNSSSSSRHRARR